MPRLLNPIVVAVRPGAGGEDEWVAALRALTPEACEVLKADGAASVHRASVLGQDVVVKVWEWRSAADRIKLLLGVSRARRQWRGADRLAALGVPVALPLVLAKDFEPTVHRECLVLGYVAGRTLIDEMDSPRGSIGDQHRLAAAVGAQVGRIVSGGCFNRDHKPSNLVVSTSGGAPSVGVLDTVAIRRCPRGSVRRAAQMLASLHIEPSGVGCPARRTLRARCVRSTAREILARAGASASRAARKLTSRLLWDAATHLVAAHGDPTPAVDPRRGRA